MAKLRGCKNDELINFVETIRMILVAAKDESELRKLVENFCKRIERDLKRGRYLNSENEKQR